MIIKIQKVILITEINEMNKFNKKILKKKTMNKLQPIYNLSMICTNNIIMINSTIIFIIIKRINYKKINKSINKNY